MEKGQRAARLAKADLLTEVSANSELQGLMGNITRWRSEDASVAAACEEYTAARPERLVPTDDVSINVALADKADTLVGFWRSTKSPQAVRSARAQKSRAGVIRIALSSKKDLVPCCYSKSTLNDFTQPS
jgi:glycyl-tRNA synthetase beta chain